MFTEQEFNRVLEFFNTPDPTTGRTVWDMALTTPNQTDNEGGRIVQTSDDKGIKISGGKGHRYISIPNNDYGLGKDMLPFVKNRTIRLNGQDVVAEEVKINPYAWKLAIAGTSNGLTLNKTEAKGAESIYAQLTQKAQLTEEERNLALFLAKALGKDAAAIPAAA